MVDPGLLAWASANRQSKQYARATIINAHSLPEIVWSCLLFFSSRLTLIFTLLTFITTLLRVCVPFFNSLFIFTAAEP